MLMRPKFSFPIDVALSSGRRAGGLRVVSDDKKRASDKGGATKVRRLRQAGRPPELG